MRKALFIAEIWMFLLSNYCSLSLQMDLHFQSHAVLALEEATEAYLVSLFHVTNLCYSCQEGDHYAQGHSAC